MRSGREIFIRKICPRRRCCRSTRSRFLREFTGIRAALECRQDSWLDKEIVELPKSRNIALCSPNTHTSATPRKITADYGQLRLRGEEYAEAGVRSWSEFVSGQQAN